MTQKCEEASHPMFFCAELFPKWDLKSQTTQTKTIIIRSVLACNQLCNLAAACDWFDQYNRNQEAHRREGPELSTEDFTNLAHRTDRTASGNQMRENEEHFETIAQCHKNPVFQRLEKGTHKDHLCAESIRNIAVILIHTWHVPHKIMCALVQSWIQKQRIWQQNLPICSWVLIGRGFNQYASLIFDLERFTAEEADRISHFEETFRSQGDFARTQTKHNHRVIKNRKPLLTTTIRVNAALSQRGPPVNLAEERLWLPIQASLKYDHCLKAFSKKAHTRHELKLKHRRGDYDHNTHDPRILTVGWSCYQMLQTG